MSSDSENELSSIKLCSEMDNEIYSNMESFSQLTTSQPMQKANQLLTSNKTLRTVTQRVNGDSEISSEDDESVRSPTFNAHSQLSSSQRGTNEEYKNRDSLDLFVPLDDETEIHYVPQSEEERNLAQSASDFLTRSAPEKRDDFINFLLSKVQCSGPIPSHRKRTCTYKMKNGLLISTGSSDDRETGPNYDKYIRKLTSAICSIPQNQAPKMFNPEVEEEIIVFDQVEGVPLTNSRSNQSINIEKVCFYRYSTPVYDNTTEDLRKTILELYQDAMEDYNEDCRELFHCYTSNEIFYFEGVMPTKKLQEDIRNVILNILQNDSMILPENEELSEHFDDIRTNDQSTEATTLKPRNTGEVEEEKFSHLSRRNTEFNPLPKIEESKTEYYEEEKKSETESSYEIVESTHDQRIQNLAEITFAVEPRPVSEELPEPRGLQAKKIKTLLDFLEPYVYQGISLIKEAKKESPRQQQMNQVELVSQIVVKVFLFWHINKFSWRVDGLDDASTIQVYHLVKQLENSQICSKDDKPNLSCTFETKDGNKFSVKRPDLFSFSNSPLKIMINEHEYCIESGEDKMASVVKNLSDEINFGISQLRRSTNLVNPDYFVWKIQFHQNTLDKIGCLIDENFQRHCLSCVITDTEAIQIFEKEFRNSINSTDRSMDLFSTLDVIINIGSEQVRLFKLKYDSDSPNDYQAWEAKLELITDNGREKIKVQLARELEQYNDPDEDPYNEFRSIINGSEFSENPSIVVQPSTGIDLYKVKCRMLHIFNFEENIEISRSSIKPHDGHKPVRSKQSTYSLSSSLYNDKDAKLEKSLEKLFSLSKKGKHLETNNEWAVLALAVLELYESFANEKIRKSFNTYPIYWDFTEGNYGNAEIVNLKIREQEAINVLNKVKFLKQHYSIKVFRVQNYIAYLSLVAIKRYYNTKPSIGCKTKELLVYTQSDVNLDKSMTTHNMQKMLNYLMRCSTFPDTEDQQDKEWKNFMEENQQKVFIIDCEVVLPKRSKSGKKYLPFVLPKYILELEPKKRSV